MLYDKGPTAMYLAFADGVYLASRLFQPLDDERGVRELTELAPEAASRRCSPELAKIGKSFGLEESPMDPEVAEYRAVVALMAAWQSGDQLGIDTTLMFARAIRPFFEAAPWKTTPEHVRRRASFDLRTPEGRGITDDWTLQILSNERPDGPGLVVRGDRDLVSVLGGRAASLAANGPTMRPTRLSIALSTEPAWAAAAMEDAFGVRRFPRVADSLEEILFPIKAARLAFATQALRAAARLAIVPDASATHESVLEGLTARFTLHPEPIDASDDNARYDAWGTLRREAREAAHALLARTPDAMLGCDVVMVWKIDDGVGAQLSRSNEKAQRKAGQRALRGERIRVGDERSRFRAEWLRLPPILEMVKALLGDKADLFFSKQPVTSIRVLILIDGKPSIFDVDYEPMRTRELQDAARMAKGAQPKKRR